jgi:hypothetical protein
VAQDRISQPCWASIRKTTHSPFGRSPTSESGRHQSCPDEVPSEGPNLPSPMPGNGHRFPEFLYGMIDIAQTGAATSGRIWRSMRLHPHRQHEFAVLSRINSDPSPFGIYHLAPPLDLIARPEDCAGKVQSNRSDKRRCAASYRRTHAGREIRIKCRDGHSASRLLFCRGSGASFSARSRSRRYRAIALAKSVSTVYQEQHLVSRSRFRKTALDPDRPH